MQIRIRLNSVTRYRTILNHASSMLTLKTPLSLSFKIVGLSATKPESPPVIILHSLLGHKTLWKGAGKTITHIAKRTTIVVDIRNHGNSPHINSNRYDEMAVDLLHLFDKLHIDKAYLVGYDIGGRMAMCTALIAPKRVAALVVIDISPVSTSDHMKSMIKVLKAMKAVDFKNAKKIHRAKVEVKKQLEEKVNDDIVMYKLLSNIKVKQNGIIGWGCNLDALIKHFKHLLVFPKMRGKMYEGPCLFIGGQLSEYIPADDLTKIRELFPQVVIKYVVKTGHYLHLEDPRTVLELLINFLADN